MSESTSATEQSGPLSGKERAGILMHEYDSLRSEIISRTSNTYQLFAMVIIVVGWVATSGQISLFWKVVLAILLGIAVYLYLLIDRDIRKAAQRIREIEEQVDRETDGWYLLRWERLWGGAKTSFLFFRRARPKAVPDDPRQPPAG